MIAEKIIEIWGKELFHVGKTSFSISSLTLLSLSLTALFIVASIVKRLLANKVFPQYNIDRGTAASIATIVRYALIVLGSVIVLQTSGIDLSALGILFGALGIGIGFGLQNISNNFISGIIILFERPIKIGDRIEVDGIAGNIVNISARATTIITNDNIAIVVPNSQFINSTVINWSLNDNKVRFNFPIGVAYKENPEVIKQLLLEVALSTDGVLREPPPDVLFEDFADSSLQFNLRVWSSEYSDKPKVLKSKLYYAIFEKFKQHSIEIPFPQRDLHIKSGIALNSQYEVKT